MKFIISLLFLQLTVILQAQKRSFDSLQAILKTEKNDTTRINLLYQISSYCKEDKDMLLYVQQSLQLAEKSAFRSGISNSLFRISTIYLKQKKYRLAEIFGSRSLQTAQQIGYPVGIRNACEMLSEAYNQTGNYQKSLEMLELFKLMADSVNDMETQKASLKKQMQYDFDKKETEKKAEQEKKDVATSENLKKQKLNRDCFIAGFGLVLLLAIFIFWSYRQKHKANIIITSKKLEAERQKTIIEEKQKEILDSIYYAKRIQTALLPTEMAVEKNLKRLLRK